MVRADRHAIRINPGFGLSSVVDATPARHTAGGSGWVEWGLIDPKRFQKQLEPFIPDLKRDSIMSNKFNYEQSGQLQALCSSFQHGLNVVGLCTFPVYVDPDFPVVDLLNGATGLGMDFDDFLKMGERVNTLRHCFNLREGTKPSDFKLPDRIKGTIANEAGGHKGVKVDIDKLKKRYFDAVDWDSETGLPSKKKIAELGIEKLVSDLY